MTRFAKWGTWLIWFNSLKVVILFIDLMHWLQRSCSDMDSKNMGHFQPCWSAFPNLLSFIGKKKKYFLQHVGSDIVSFSFSFWTWEKKWKVKCFKTSYACFFFCLGIIASAQIDLTDKSSIFKVLSSIRKKACSKNLSWKLWLIFMSCVNYCDLL